VSASGNLRRRLDRLEATGRFAPPTWSSPEVYAQLVEGAREDIAGAETEGERPLYRVGDDGVIYAASDGRPIRHSHDYYVGVLDERIRELEAEVVADTEAPEGEGGSHS
jgi:hypothetical protein